MKEYAGKVLMLMESVWSRDARVPNEAYTLVSAGYKVSAISIRDKGEKSKENIQGVNVYRVSEITFFSMTRIIDIDTVTNKHFIHIHTY